MTLRRTQCLAAALLFIILSFFHPADTDAAKKRPRRKARRRAVPAAPADIVTGNTLQERLASLMNGPTARASDTSIKIVDVESGQVVGERNAHLPLAPASNTKLFSTGAAVDLLGPNF